MQKFIFSHPLFSRVFLTSLFIFISVPDLYAAKPAHNSAQQVIVSPVVIKELADRIEALGTARANESVSISSNVTEKVNAILFDDGQQVKAGDTLIVLENAEEQADLQQAKAVEGERKLSYNRLRRLAKKNLATTEDLDRARLALEQANASINAIQARIDDRIIRAPFDGTTGLRELSVGTLIESGDTVVTLDDTRTIKLEFSVPAVFLAELKTGLKIEARTDSIDNKTYLGKIKSVDSRVDPVTRSVKVRAILDNTDGRILPGILMQVDLLRNLRNALVIPEAALLPSGSKQFVMLRKTSGNKELADLREITIGTRIPGWVEVISGLLLSEQVITHGNDKVQHGAAIKILAVDDGKVDISKIIKGKAAKGKQP